MKPNLDHCFEYFKRSLSNKFSSLKQILFVVVGASWFSSALLCGVACLSSPRYSEESIKIVCVFPVLFSLFCYHVKYPVIFMYIHWSPKVKEGHFNLSFKADTQSVWEACHELWALAVSHLQSIFSHKILWNLVS